MLVIVALLFYWHAVHFIGVTAILREMGVISSAQ